jgi:hypothetical protein
LTADYTAFSIIKELSLFQNSVSFEQALGKIGLKPAFSLKSKEAVPKTEVLEQPQLLIFWRYLYERKKSFRVLPDGSFAHSRYKRPGMCRRGRGGRHVGAIRK